MRTATRFVRLALCSLVLTLSAATIASAQAANDTEATKAEDFSIASLRLVDVPGNHYIRVNLSDKQDVNFEPADTSAANIRIKFLPSGRTVPTSEIDAASTVFISGFNQQVLQIGLTNAPTTKPAPGDDRVEVTLMTLHFVNAANNSETRTDVSGSGPIFDATNINDLVKSTEEALKNAVAAAKTTDEKNIFAAFNVSVPSGDDSDTEGSADIVINRNLQNLPFGQSFFDQLNFGLKIKKATENRADPRHFETGLTFRKTFLINRSKIRLVADALQQTAPGDVDPARTATSVRLKNGFTSDKPEQIINDLQKDFFRGLVLDNGIKFEGDIKGVSVGNVTNLVYDGQLQVTTVARAIGKSRGFWNFRWLPVGVEAGYNLKNEDDPNHEKHSLARFKTGGVLTLFYQADNDHDFLNRVEFETQAVNRYLFKRETLFDPDSQKNILVDKGNKYWLQADLKFLFGTRIGPGRMGFRSSFQRGSLPPTYAFTKVFTFSLLFETGDEDTSREIKIR
jgi:hypothetical protein